LDMTARLVISTTGIPLYEVRGNFEKYVSMI